MICQTCDEHVCVPCSKHYFEPKDAYRCHLCQPDKPKTKYNESTFECSLCFNEFTVDAEVSVKECHHKTMRACSSCMFKYIYTVRSNCPFCNQEADHLLHVETHAVANVNKKRVIDSALEPSRADERPQAPILVTEISSFTPEINNRCCSNCSIL